MSYSKITLISSFLLITGLFFFAKSEFYLRLKIAALRNYTHTGSNEIIEPFPDYAIKGPVKKEETTSIENQSNQRMVELPNNSTNWELIEKTTILERTELWEFPSGLAKDSTNDSLGYPTVVKNIYGNSANNKYYLFYAHHDPTSGIGCAIADTIEGPYYKIAQKNKKLKDSRVLISPDVPRGTGHYSSPCVLWDAARERWLMYFHYHENEFARGRGHQKTGMAYTYNLTANSWTIIKKKNGLPKDVLPTTQARWMNSQSSYHSIHKLTTGWFVAFLRGTGGEIDSIGQWEQDTTKLGFAISKNGEDWIYSPSNPIIVQTEKTKNGVFRPHFIFQKKDEHTLLWSEAMNYDYSQTLSQSEGPESHLLDSRFDSR